MNRSIPGWLVAAAFLAFFISRLPSRGAAEAEGNWPQFRGADARGVAALVLAVLMAMLAHGKAATFSDEISRLAMPLVDASGMNVNRAVGLVVVVVTQHGSQVFGFGLNRVGETTVPDGDTYFQIASVSKSMTGLLLASAIEGSAGAVNASDPVNFHLAPDLRVPDFQGQPVTLAHLATHYGSLPDMPNNLTGPPTSPAQNYSRTQLTTYLSTLTLGTAPGTAYSYSNLGSGLLALALVDRSGFGSYSALLQNQLTGPLGMSSSGLNEAPFVNQLGTRLAQGYRLSGGVLVPVGLSDMGVLEGGGEVISTGNDMGKLLRAYTGLLSLPVLGAVARATAAAAPGTQGAMTGYGLDIVFPPNGVVQYEKAGVVAGYTTFIAFRREPASGVVVLSNRGQHQAILPLARQVLALLTPPSLSVDAASPGLMSINFTAAARLSYDVQTSPDLIEWTTIATLTNSADSPTTLGTTVSMTPPRFVRLRY